jgi:hypothetical protein
MPKYPKEEEKIDYIKEFVYLTWEAVRRNPDYQRDYRRFLESHGLTPDDFKPKKNPDGSIKISFHPANQGVGGYFDPREGWFVFKEEAPDPDKCNLSYILARWGFACDPDTLPLCGPSWATTSHILSKEWRKRIRKSENMPVLIFSENLKKLPGVLDVERNPKVSLNHPDPGKAMNEVIDQGGGGGVVNYDLLPWEVENPANLTVTINLQAPSQLIRYVFELLVEICKSELKIPDKKIEARHIKKCFQLYDLVKEGLSVEEITQQVDLTHYKKDEAEKDKERGYYVEVWGGPQIGRCIKNAEQWIIKGSII